MNMLFTVSITNGFETETVFEGSTNLEIALAFVLSTDFYTNTYIPKVILTLSLQYRRIK